MSAERGKRAKDTTRLCTCSRIVRQVHPQGVNDAMVRLCLLLKEDAPRLIHWKLCPK